MSNPLFDAMLAQSVATKKTVKQQKIVETAIRLFAEKGYANTSTAEIAKSSGVSEGMIFKQYGTKENMLLSLIVPFIGKLIPSLVHTALKETLTENIETFEQFLRALLRNRAAFISENKEVFRVVVKEILYKDDIRNKLLPLIVANVPPLFNPVIERFKANGELRDLPNEQILQTMMTFFGGFFVSRFLLFDRSSISEEEIEEAVRFIMNGLASKAD